MEALMQTPPTFDIAELRIQTLTSILQKMDRRCPPTSDRKQVPDFLRHLATLLTCDAPDAKGVIAVTGTLAAEELRTLVVNQNPSGSSNVSEFGVHEITKSSGTFEEAVKHKKNANLAAHISDVWAAMASYDPTDKNHFSSFCRFIVARCYQKLSKRVYQDRGWNVNVWKKIYDWTPDNENIEGVRWIDRPMWVLHALPPDSTGLDGMTAREISKSGQLVTQWEFSAATLKSWALLLATFIQQLELSVAATRDAREKKQTENEVEGIEKIAGWCQFLYLYVHWKEDVVKTLLTKTSLARGFDFRRPLKMSDDTELDDLADLRTEPHESEGHQVLRHLQGIVAWHAAATSLVLNRNSRQFTQSLVIGLVEVAPTKLGPEGPDLMTSEEVIQEYLSRYPAPSPEACDSIKGIIRNNYKTNFTGTTHAEATLMGLLTYFSPGSPFVNHGPPINEDNVQFLRKLVGPAPCKAIAVGKKCCWCCDRLDNLLGDIKLPGSHGVIYAWSPPRVGLDVTVLQAFENALWDELDAAVSDARFLVHSLQSSGSSTVAEETQPLLMKHRRR